MLKKLMKTWPYVLMTVILTGTLGMLEGYMMIRLMNLFDLALSKQMHMFKTYSLELLSYALMQVPLAIAATLAKNLFKKKANESMKYYYLEGIYGKNINEFHAQNNAKYLSTLTNDFNTIEMKLIDSLYMIIDFGTVFVAGLWMIWTVNPWFALIGLGLVTVNTTITVLSNKPINKQTKLRSDLFETYTSYIKEVLSAFHIIKNNNLYSRIKDNFRKQSETLQHKGYLIDRMLTYVYGAQNLSSDLMVLIVIGIAGYFALTGRGTVGSVLLAVEGMYRILWPINMISEAMPGLLSTKGIIEKIEETLKNTVEYEEHEEEASLKEAIYFDKVTFAYEGQDEILAEVDATFKKGGKYLIIGPSGGGKSTLLKLLRKYFNPIKGTIWIDHKPLKGIKKEAYFRKITNVEQKVFLFEDTLRNNLTLYKDYSEEEIWAALTKAGLKEFVKTHEGGLDYMIYEDGKNVSGGEKSRIAIARGLLEHADLILLDEAFSALDYDKAREIEQSLLELEDVTVIHISHVLFKEHEEQYDGVYMVKNKKVYPYKKTPMIAS